MSKCENVNMSKCIIVTLNLRTLFNLLHCQINILLMQDNNANILKKNRDVCVMPFCYKMQQNNDRSYKSLDK